MCQEEKNHIAPCSDQKGWVDVLKSARASSQRIPGFNFLIFSVRLLCLRKAEYTESSIAGDLTKNCPFYFFFKRRQGKVHLLLLLYVDFFFFSLHWSRKAFSNQLMLKLVLTFKACILHAVRVVGACRQTPASQREFTSTCLATQLM